MQANDPCENANRDHVFNSARQGAVADDPGRDEPGHVCQTQHRVSPQDERVSAEVLSAHAART